MERLLMTTWIGHLRIAERILDEIDDLSASDFAVGSVAPDSGVLNEGAGSFEPPVSVTHLRDPERAPWRRADLEFYRRYIASLDQVNSDRQQLSFLLGYFCHLVTDNLWAYEVLYPTREQYTAEFEADPDFIWTVKHDWYALDVLYVRNNPASLFWTDFLDTEYRNDYLPFLTQDGVQQRVEHIKTFYRRTDDEMEEWLRTRPGRYLSEPEMKHFIEQTATRFCSIYRYLIAKQDDVPAYYSALELPIKALEGLQRDVRG
jgi:hypothetical protein